MVDITSIGVVDDARQGDMTRLLLRLHKCNLSPQEKKFIEHRLIGKTEVIKRGPKRSPIVHSRKQEILIANAWLEFRFGLKKIDDRYKYIGNKIGGLSKTRVRNSVSETTPTLSTWMTFDYIKNAASFFGCGDEAKRNFAAKFTDRFPGQILPDWDFDKPSIICDTPISPN